MIRATVHGLLFGFLLTAGDPARQNESHQRERPRIAIAGLAIESSTFSPARTVEEDFHAERETRSWRPTPSWLPGRTTESAPDGFRR